MTDTLRVNASHFFFFFFGTNQVVSAILHFAWTSTDWWTNILYHLLEGSGIKKNGYDRMALDGGASEYEMLRYVWAQSLLLLTSVSSHVVMVLIHSTYLKHLT